MRGCNGARSADFCGNLTVTERLTGLFGNLSDAEYAVTSPEDVLYNCIAFAADDTSQKWWPNAPTYWPIAEREESIPNFLAAFQTLGYEECASAELEDGVEKIALYADADAIPTHMALQTESGKWKSKLGDFEDIEHATLDQLNGFDYGQAVTYLKRKRACS